MQSNQAVLSPADILTPKELAKRLKVKPGWVYEKMRPRQRNPLPAFHTGRYLRFSWPAIVAWLESTTQHTRRKAVRQ